MATTHQLAVVTNSCLKSPVNPKTGLVYTADELEADQFRKPRSHDSENEQLSKDQNDVSKFQLSQSVNFDTTIMDTMVGMNVDLSDMSDTEFFKRLTDLKNEHKKTLEFCEKLYNEKLSESKISAVSTANPVPVASIDKGYILSSAGTATKDCAEDIQVYSEEKPKDKSAAKPPTGRPRPSLGTPTRSGSPKTRQAWTGTKSDENNWRSSMANSSDTEASGDELYQSFTSKSFMNSLEESRLSSHSKIEEMWENFSVNDYTPDRPVSRRHRSNSLSKLPSTQKENNKSKEWRHRITIPKPFSMTLRESRKTPVKTKAMEEVDRKREERLRKEEEECQKKFKAKPVPAHVYMPLYDEIMEDNETKRRMLRKVSAEVLQSMQKPFKFDVRDQEKKKYRRSHSNPSSTSDLSKKPKTSFKAKPYPEHLFQDNVTDRMKEDEEYRKIRIQMRAEELLHSSKLPPNMAAKGREYTEGKSRQKLYAEKAKRAGFTSDHKFSPKVNANVPDFEELHHKFLWEVSKKKQQKEATVCKPFKLKSAQGASKRHKIYDDIAMDEESLKENRWPFQSSRSRPLSKSTSALSTSMDSIPTKMTAAAHMRSSSTKMKLMSQMEKELKEQERARVKKQQEKKLRKYIGERAATNDNTCILQNSSRNKLREYRRAEKARQEEYRHQLDEMKERLQDRPLLFERTMQKNAIQKAERKYQETIQRAGLDDDFINTKGGTASSEDDVDQSEEDFSTHYSSHHPSQSQSLSASQKYTQEFEGDEDNKTDDEQEELEEDYHSQEDSFSQQEHLSQEV